MGTLPPSGSPGPFGGRSVLSGANLEVGPGEAIGSVGANGSGNATMLSICAGLLRRDEGEVRRSERVGYCPQQPGLVDLLNADEHLVLFGSGLGLSRGEALAKGRATLESVGSPVGDPAVARDLSGGTRQKLNIPSCCSSRAFSGLRHRVIPRLLGACRLVAGAGKSGAEARQSSDSDVTRRQARPAECSCAPPH